MTDRELLEAAAKAAGYTIEYWAADDYPVVRDGDKNVGWSPLRFDSDALRLAVKLQMSIVFADGQIELLFPERSGFAFDADMSDPYAATRRAIVRAAAEMAK